MKRTSSSNYINCTMDITVKNINRIILFPVFNFFTSRSINL